MLDKHLIAKTLGKADDKNIALWKDYRVTVLTDRLFRIEYNREHIWRDGATQSVWYRNVAKQEFTVAAHADFCEIATPSVKLVLREAFDACEIMLDGKILPLTNDGNLLGTYRTLDNCDGELMHENSYLDSRVIGEVPLGVGVCSKSGVAVIDDAKSLTLGDDGMIKPERAADKDIYVFAYGSDYRAAVNALYKITGMPPVLPRYALGNWWSRYYAYTDKSYLTLLDKFERRGVPLTVATIDMDWHWSFDLDAHFKITEQGLNGREYGGASGWTGYSWNTDLFPDYKAFLGKIKDRNLHITLNLHPADGMRWFEDCYNDMARAMDVDPQTKVKIPFDIADERFINNYFSVMHKPYEKDGVGFWWIDWQQGETSSLDGLDPLWSLNHYHFMDIAANGEKPLILSRYAGIGSHRYPIGFSGDAYITWNTLKYLPFFTATASNVGYTTWSHDIGGHMWGATDGELYLRSVQFGVFSPINRLHCSAMKGVTKEPWFYVNGTGDIAEDFLRFRHRLIPFLYSASFLTHKIGKALVEPMYYDHPDSEYAYKFPQEYLFGGLIVSPVTEKLHDDGYARVEMWLPCGKYTDIFTGDEYDIARSDGKCVTLMRRLESLPVLAKAGTILPLSLDSGNSSENPEMLEIKVYSGTGEYTLYEDNENGSYTTHFTVNQTKDGSVELTISGKGDGSVVPANRRLRISFENIRNGIASLTVGGKHKELDEEYFERLTVTLDYNANDKYKIIAKDNNTDFDNLLMRITDILTSAEESIFVKDLWLNSIRSAKTSKEISVALDDSELCAATKMKVKEILPQ